MAIDFASMLTTDQKRQLIENRIQQFAAEAYQYSLNKKTAESIQSQEQADQATNAIAVLEEAIRVHKEELATLPEPTE